MNCSLFVDGVSLNDTLVVPNATEETNYANSGGTHFFNVSSSEFDSGFHIWNVTCYDKANHMNATAMWVGENNYVDVIGGNFTLTDNVKPTIATPTFSASSVTRNTAVVVTCVGADTITTNPVEWVSIKDAGAASWQGDLGVSPYTYTGTGAIGTYTARCRSQDTAGNIGGYSSEATFAVAKAASSSGGTVSSGSSASGKVSVTVLTGQTKDLGVLSGKEGVINAYRASTVTFSVKTSSMTVDDSHSIMFDDVDYIGKKVTITIRSDPVTLSLNVGDVETVDIDGDGVDDLEITLNSIDSNGKANLNVEGLGASAPGVDQEVTGGEEGTTGEEDTSSGGMAWYWWLIILIVIVVIVAFVLPKRR